MIGDVVTVHLPYEAIRATVTRVVNTSQIEAKLDVAVPFTKLHGYGPNQKLMFRREKTIFGVRWDMVPSQPRFVEPKPDEAVSTQAPPDEPAVVKPRVVQTKKVRRRSDAEARK